MLTALSDCLRQQGRASLNDLALVLDSSPTAVEEMLKLLERKGRVRRLPAGSSCGKSACGGCHSSEQVIYEWAAPPPTTV